MQNYQLSYSLQAIQCEIIQCDAASKLKGASIRTPNGEKPFGKFVGRDDVRRFPNESRQFRVRRRRERAALALALPRDLLLVAPWTINHAHRHHVIATAQWTMTAQRTDEPNDLS